MPQANQNPRALAVLALLVLACGFAISSRRAVSKADYIAQHIPAVLPSATSQQPPANFTIFCDSVSNVTKEYMDEDIACDRIGTVEDVYIIKNDTIGTGQNAKGVLLTHKQSRITYVARFLKPTVAAKFSARADAVKTINLARRACGHSDIMQLADMKCYKGSLNLVWTRCEGPKLRQLIYHTKKNATCPLTALSRAEIETVVKQLVDIVNYMMERRLIHGDINFQNIFYQRQKRKVCLIDYDASRALDTDFHLPSQRMYIEQQEEIGTINRNMGWHRIYQDDMLAVGTILGGLIGIPRLETDTSKRMNPWQMENTIKLLGVDDYRQYKKQYNLTKRVVPHAVLATLPAKRTNWSEYITDCNRHLATADAVDFFDKVMRYSFIERYEFFHRHAAAHPFLQLLPPS